MANFRDIIGQEQIKHHFQSAISHNKVSHAYIIYGEKGSGRSMITDAFVKTLLCEKKELDACDACKSCIQAETYNHPDIHYISHATASIGVKDIREQIDDDILIKPYSSDYKVYIVPDADKMTAEAQNALLKTIEEPPVYGIIILIAENVNALLPTIRSRCVTLGMKAVSKEQIASYLMSHLKMEPERATIAAGFCQGNIGRALRFATDDDFLQKKTNTLNLLKNLNNLSVSEIIQTIELITKDKADVYDYIDLMLLWYHDILMFKVTKDTNLLLYQDEYQELSKQASLKSYENLEQIIQAIDKAKIRLKANVDVKIAMELMILTMKE